MGYYEKFVDGLNKEYIYLLILYELDKLTELNVKQVIVWLYTVVLLNYYFGIANERCVQRSE